MIICDAFLSLWEYNYCNIICFTQVILIYIYIYRVIREQFIQYLHYNLSLGSNWSIMSYIYYICNEMCIRATNDNKSLACLSQASVLLGNIVCGVAGYVMRS